MTQIKLRRDTSTAFASSNPILGNGEPAYETDTKKLKIGDGTTAYTQLEYFSAGGSGLEVCDIGMALYIDETKGLRRYLNGQIVDINTNTQAFLNRLKEITTLHPSLLCTEEEWQTAKTMSAFGQVGKLVFNYSGENIVSVRLPRVVNVQGLFDLQNLGMTVSSGLPNITGYVGASNEPDYDGEPNGAFYRTGAGHRQGHQYNVGGVGFDASRSNPIYGNSTTVQPEAIQYPYFIQIATGVETEANIVNTLENVNGFTLLESKYSDKPLYNESWLLSNGQYNPKATYPTAYEGLQVEYNTEIEAGTTVTLPSGVSYTKRGLSVKLSTETYTDYDFVLNTADETFRLPLIAERVLIESKKATDEDPTWYNLYSDGWCEQGGRVSVNNDATSTATFKKKFKDTRYYANWISCNGAESTGTGTRASDSLTTTSMRIYNGQNCVMLANWTACGYTDTSTITSNCNLYFYVGDLDQNHGIVNMGRIGEQLANKVDTSNTQWATNACMPDYSAGVTQTVNNPYTMSIDGVVYYYGFGQTQEPKLVLNGVTLSLGSRSDAYGGGISGWIPMPKGNTYKFIGQTNKITFYPLKGAK